MDLIIKIIKFTLANSQKVFIGIIVFMLIIFTFVQAFIRIILEIFRNSHINEERIPLILPFGLEFKLLSTQYDLVVNIILCMVLMYFSHIIVYILKEKFNIDISNQTGFPYQEPSLEIIDEIEEKNTIDNGVRGEFRSIDNISSSIPEEIKTNKHLFGG